MLGVESIKNVRCVGFPALRERMDPGRRSLGPYLRTLFGLEQNGRLNGSGQATTRIVGTDSSLPTTARA